MIGILTLLIIILVATIGYLAQTTGLCMVRGVAQWKAGKPEFLIAILFSGVFIWVAASVASFWGLTIPFRSFSANIWFLFGGVLFGLGTAFNQGCGVSTLSKLARGDIKMIATIIGWLLGWLLLSLIDFNNPSVPYSLSYKVIYGVLILLSIGLGVWVLTLDNVRRKLWLSMFGVGLLAGFVFIYEPNWPPNGLLYGISSSTLAGDHLLFPGVERFLFFIALLFGMFVAAWRANHFMFVKANVSQWLLHLLAGTLMGVGAAITQGGNDSQLLLALPSLSPSGFLAIAGIILGIFSGLYARNTLLIKSS